MCKLKNLLRNLFKKNLLGKKSILVFIVSVPILLGSLIYFNNFSRNKSTNNINTTTNSLDNAKTESHNNDTDELKSQEIRFGNTKLINDNIGIPVLYYHSVTSPASNEVTITPENLRTQLKYIKDEGYTTLTMNELENYLLNNSPIPEKSIVITFDDGYMDNYYNAFPILKEFNMVATIFCITSDLDGSYYLSKDAIKEMSSYGLDIESHTVNHPHLNKQTYEEQLKQMKESKKTLELITDKKVTSIAYPFGDFNDDSIKAAKASGYTLAFTTNRGLSDRTDDPLKLDRIYINSAYDMTTFKEVLTKTKK